MYLPPSFFTGLHCRIGIQQMLARTPSPPATQTLLSSSTLPSLSSSCQSHGDASHLPQKTIAEQEVQYFTYNSTMVSTIQPENFHLHPGDWRLRPTLYEFKLSNGAANFVVRLDGTSHNLAQQALHSSNSTACSYVYL